MKSPVYRRRSKKSLTFRIDPSFLMHVGAHVAYLPTIVYTSSTHLLHPMYIKKSLKYDGKIERCIECGTLAAAYCSTHTFLGIRRCFQYARLYVQMQINISHVSRRLYCVGLHCLHSHCFTNIEYDMYCTVYNAIPNCYLSSMRTDIV